MVCRTVLLLGILGGFMSLVAHAQDPSSAQQLMPVTVRAFAPERYMAGLKVQRIDSALVEAYRYQTLADLLALQAPLQFKSYGPGQLTTAGLRGTSANHTAVLWNGVNINSPSLGQTDFSTIPVAGFDQLSIQYGSAASCVGTDAVGGSILLNSTPGSRPGLLATIGHRLGPYGSQQTQGGIRFVAPLANGSQFAGKTYLYGGLFRYQPVYTERRGYLVEPSQTGQQGLIQDLFFRDKSNRQLSVNVWLTDTKLTLAPADTIGREITRTQAYRLLTSYEFGQAQPSRWLSGKTLIRAGFIRDITDYGRGATFDTNPSHAQTDRYILRTEHELEKRLGQTNQLLTIKTGIEWVHYAARVDGYGETVLHENRADVYALIRYQPTARLLAAINLRQAFVTGYNPPFTPSIGLEYKLIAQGNWRLNSRLNVARSYRVPTLNERYWQVLGNPDLRPERGFAQDLGLTLNRTTAQNAASVSVSAFRNHVDDWTYWNPDRNYRVENLQEVLAQGLEVQTQFSRKTGRWQLGGFAQYALTRSTQLHSYDPWSGNVVGKQLIYLPLHTASATAFMQYGQHRLTLTWQGVDQRPYVFDNSRYLPAYQLVNLLAETRIRSGKWQGRVVAQIDNLFNEFYLNVKRNVMPGRTVALTLVLMADTNSSTL